MASRYSVVGLGKLGASMAAAIASRGFDVIYQLLRDIRHSAGEKGNSK